MKLNKIISFFAAVALVSAMSSCSDDDVVTPITSDSELETLGTSFDTLSFEWDKMAGVTQYGYELLDPNGDVVYRDVTNVATATIGSLKPATEYTLRVWGYPAIGSGYTQSEPIIIKATTDPLKTLGTPVLTFTQETVSNVATWKKITGATSYDYILTNSVGEEIETGSVTSTSRTVTFTHLDNGQYTLSVTAISTTPGYETSGEAAVGDFTVNITELWRAEGTYNSAVLGKSWDATIVCYGEGHYTLLNWYGVNGYNFDFYTDSTDPEHIFNIYNYYTYDETTGDYEIPTGRSDLGALKVYPWYNESKINGTSAKGTASFSINLNNSYVNDTYTWKGTYDGIPADEFVGSWKVKTSGWTYIDSQGTYLDDWLSASATKTIQITKVDDTTIAMPVPFFPTWTMNVEIDMIEKTLTVQPFVLDMEYDFTLAGTAGITSPVIGTINDDGSFEFNDIDLWYEAGDGGYLYNFKAKYTKAD